MSAYQDENGKWYKQCSTTKQVFGPVDTKEELSQWFFKKNKSNKDGFASECKEVSNKRLQQYRKENPDKIRERKKEYDQENADIRKEYYKQYRQTAAGLFNKYKRSAKQRNINFTLTCEWFDQQMTKPEFNICAISGIEFVQANGHITHPLCRSLDRISSTKGYTPDNVRWVCFKYNSWKSDLTIDDIARIFKYTAQSHNLDPHEILNQVS